MGINVLHHVTVKTDDLEATRDFYRDVLGLEEGFRPDLAFPGYWLYCGDLPVVHLVPRENAIGGGPSSRNRSSSSGLMAAEPRSTPSLPISPGQGMGMTRRSSAVAGLSASTWTSTLGFTSTRTSAESTARILEASGS